MSSEIDYTRVVVPSDKPRTEYSYVERRAELLQLIEEAGHPRAVNQSELGERYGVSQQQISKDFDRLAEYVSEHLGDEHVFIMRTVFHGAMLDLIDDGDPYRAARVAKWWSDWLSKQESQSDRTSASKSIEQEAMDSEKLEMYHAICEDAVPNKFSVK